MSELFYPHGGGAELATYLHAKLLSERGFRIVVVTSRFDGEPSISKSENMTIHRLALFQSSESVKYSTLLRMDVLLSSFIRRLISWADVVYIPRFWFSAILLAKAYKKNVVTHLHDYIPICPLANLFDVSKNVACNKKGSVCSQKCIYVYERTNNRNLLGAMESTLLNSTFGWFYSRIISLSDAVVCVSKAQKHLILKNHAILPSKVYVIYNPLPEITETGLEMQGDDFGYFGGPSYMKGFHVLCKAAAFVKSIKPVTIHATKFSNPSKWSELPNHLGILTYGKLGHEEYRTLYKQIRAVIIPSVWAEPLPYVVSEAIMSGRIVIASRVGGIPEQVVGCEGTFLFEPGDYKALAKDILYVRSLSKEKTVELGVKNREFIVKKFNNEKIVGEFTDLLKKVIE
jgi:glycosyltransferase involved in cell wall biosynthesis